MAFSAAHRSLIDELGRTEPRTWGEPALLACLTRLRDGGPTEWRAVTVADAWARQDGFVVIYAMHSRRLGVSVDRRTGAGPPFFVDRSVVGEDPTPSGFGVEIADFGIAEPLGTVSEHLVLDEHGIGWWGDPPLPGMRGDP